jgi:hypothetical protein
VLAVFTKESTSGHVVCASDVAPGRPAARCHQGLEWWKIDQALRGLSAQLALAAVPVRRPGCERDGRRQRFDPAADDVRFPRRQLHRDDRLDQRQQEQDQDQQRDSVRKIRQSVVQCLTGVAPDLLDTDQVSSRSALTEFLLFRSPPLLGSGGRNCANNPQPAIHQEQDSKN